MMLRAGSKLEEWFVGQPRRCYKPRFVPQSTSRTSTQRDIYAQQIQVCGCFLVTQPCSTKNSMSSWVSAPQEGRAGILSAWRAYTESKVLVKVPELTIYFWMIKILATTVGESLADYLDATVGIGEVNTLWVMCAIFLMVWAFQFALSKYVPVVYWTVIVLISVVGTLITDNLVDSAGLQLWATIIMWATMLTLTFGSWYWSEKTLSIHSIYTRRRELFYWFAILFTFALGTGVGDQFSEGLGLGYWESALVFLGAIATDYLAYRFLKLDSIVAFWIAYILTRPLGASIGDFLSQPKDTKGLGLGPGITSAIFLGLIFTCVIYLTITKQDVIPSNIAQVEMHSNYRAQQDNGHLPESSSSTAHTTLTISNPVHSKAAIGPVVGQ